MKVTIDQIRKHYRKAPILSGVSLSARSGTMVGILGKNGCGKSTLLSILAGTLRADHGAFLYDREDGTSRPADLLKDHALASRMIGYVPQSPPLLDELSALDNLRLWYTGGRKVLERELEDGILKDLKITEFLHKNVRSLSGGMKKRLSIGCALASHPSILLLDEPGAALDLTAKEMIVRYLDHFCTNGGIVLIATHERTEIEACSSTYILRDGIAVPYRFDGDMQHLASQLEMERSLEQ